MKTIALIIAGGTGARMKQDIPKQFLTVNEKPVIVYTLEAFQNHPEIDSIAVVCVEGWEQMLMAYARQFNITKLEHVVPGGENGQGSIRNGVYELEKNFDADSIVLIHDAIRPMVSAEIISDCIMKTKQYGITGSVASCTLMTELGRKVYFSQGSEKNIKLTTVDDIDIFKALLISKRSEWLK